MCNEIFNYNKSFWHFKTENNDIIKVARSGVQEYNLKENSLMNGYIDLAQPDTFDKSYKRSVSKQDVGSFKNFGNSKSGGFYDSPFFSDLKGKYWNVMGNDITNPIFECGSKHRNASDADKVSTTMNPLAVTTHHSIFFRGPPPSPEEAFDRANGQKN